MYIMLWDLGPVYLYSTLYLYRTHITCTAHICLLYKGTDVYSLKKKKIILLFHISNRYSSIALGGVDHELFCVF